MCLGTFCDPPPPTKKIKNKRKKEFAAKCPTHLIVGGEDKLKDDEQSNQGGLCLKAKRLVQNGFVQQQRKHQEAEERVHLQTHTPP